MPTEVLVRYGTIPEVSRFDADGVAPVTRGDTVLVETHRGLQLGEILEPTRSAPKPRSVGMDNEGDEEPSSLPKIVRRAVNDDLLAAQTMRDESQAAFSTWRQRIEEWELELELIDLEWTFDRQKLILYVLNERGPDCTKLALQAAAAGLGIIEVQPVTGEGLVTVPESGGGCGSCGSH